MHRYKIVPPILLILSLTNVLLAAPVVSQEEHQTYVDIADVPKDMIQIPMSRSGSEKQWVEHSNSDEPWQKQKRGSSGPSVGGAPPAADPELATNSPPLPQTQTGGRIQDAASASELSPEINQPASDGSETGSVSHEGTKPGPGSIMAPSNRPETVSAAGQPVTEFSVWDPHDWSDTSSEPEPKETFLSKTKSFFDKLVYKFKFWPRGPGVIERGTEGVAE